MSAPTQKKARISGGQPAASEPEVFLLYEGGEVPEELRRSLRRVRISPQVTAIPEGAFRGCKKLIELQLNEGLKVIGKQAFIGCASLRSVTIPSTVTELGYEAFAYCGVLVEVQLNEGLQVIGQRAFYGCTALRSVTLPSTVTELGSRAFHNCSRLVEVHLNEGLKVIEDYAFHGCISLRSVTIPSTVTKLGGCPFFICSNLAEAIFLGGKRLLNQELFDCGFQRDEQGLLNQGAIDKILFDGYGRSAFYGCPLTSVKISISWAVSERMARLPRECRLSVEEKIHSLSRLEVQQDGNVLACFPVVRMTPPSEYDYDSDEVENFFEVQDTNHETARSLYRLLQFVAFHELKESSILLELAMWKSRIGESVSVPRADCRVAVPDPAKSLVMEYCGFVGFLEPVIEGD